MIGQARTAGMLAAGALAAAGLLLAGCTAGTSSSSTEGGVAAANGAVPHAAAPNDGAANGGSANGGAGSGGAASGAAKADSANVTDGRSLIVTAALQVRVADAPAAAARAAQAAVAAGGYVSDESVGNGPQPLPSPESADGTSVPQPAFPAVTGDANAPQAVLVLRVPPAAVESVLTELSGTGGVTYRNRASTDVTGQVADVNSRVASAQAGISELRGLIGRATNLGDLVSLEDALEQRESDLESLEAEQRALGDETQLATVTVDFFSKGTPVVAAAAHTGFVRGLLAGWHGFADVVVGVLVALGWLLPFLGAAAAAVAVLWIPVRRTLRRRRRRTSPAAELPAE